MKKDVAFSGLEAAIVLIAFVVVAAVFSYVMLGAGFFATQKAQEVTYSGIKQSTSNLVLDGQMYGDNTQISTLDLYLAIPEGGQPQKMREVSFVMSTATNIRGHEVAGASITFTAVGGAYTKIIGATQKIKVTLSAVPKPRAGEAFTLEIKPKVGASTIVSKTLPTGYAGGPIL